jgi:hypothetical protein
MPTQYAVELVDAEPTSATSINPGNVHFDFATYS